MGLGWFILTVVGGAKALQGESWRNPVKQVVKLEVLSEKYAGRAESGCSRVEDHVEWNVAAQTLEWEGPRRTTQ